MAFCYGNYETLGLSTCDEHDTCDRLIRQALFRFPLQEQETRANVWQHSLADKTR
jgi:hypothetical protein